MVNINGRLTLFRRCEYHPPSSRGYGGQASVGAVREPPPHEDGAFGTRIPRALALNLSKTNGSGLARGFLLATIILVVLCLPPAARAAESADTINKLLEEYHIELKILAHKVRILEEELEDLEFRTDRIVEDQERLVKQKGLRINGQGRMVWNNVLVGGPAVGTLPFEDTRSRVTASMFQFDFTGRPDERVLALCEMRVYHPLGGDWGTGNYFQFRRISLGVKSEKGDRYEFGDILFKHSPFTIWNPVKLYPHEPEIFRKVRAQAEWDDLIYGEEARLLGGKANIRREFHRKPFRELNFKLLLAATNDLSLAEYDQMMVFTHVDLGLGEKVKSQWGCNLLWLEDLAQSGGGESLPPIRPIKDTIVGGEGKLEFFESKLTVEGELNSCGFQGVRAGAPFSFRDSALRFGATVDLRDKYEQVRTHLGMHVMDVGPYYHAFAAQSRSFNPLKQKAFTSYNLYTGANPGFVKTHAFDPDYDGDLLVGAYRPYNRVTDNTSPYGLATPNRTGFNMEYWGDYGKKLFQPFVNVEAMSEIQPNWVFDYYDVDGSGATGFRSVEVIGGGSDAPVSIAARSFLVLEGGMGVDPLKLKWKDKTLRFQVNLKREETQNRKETPKDDLAWVVDFVTMTKQLGVQGKVSENVTILFANEWISVKDGTEYFLQTTGISTSAAYHLPFGFYNNFYVDEGIIDRYVHATFDLSQKTTSHGILYNVSDLCEIFAMYQRTDYSLDLKNWPKGLNDERAEEFSTWIRVWW